MILTTQIAALWLAALQNDAGLQAFGQSVYGKPVSLIGGASPKRPVGEKNAPFCIISCVKDERGGASPYTYTLGVDLGVIIAPGQAVLDVQTVLDQQFSAEVERVLWASSQNLDFRSIEDNFEDAFDPLFVLEKTITVTVPHTLGVAVEL